MPASHFLNRLLIFLILVVRQVDGYVYKCDIGDFFGLIADGIQDPQHVKAQPRIAAYHLSLLRSVDFTE